MSDQGSKNPFPLPSEVESVPGTDGWQDMYPYYTHFQPEDDQRFWFCNSMHFANPMSAFDVITAEVPYHGMGAFTTRVFAFPTVLGIDYRILNGRVYITANTVTDPDEIERRLEIFQRRAGRYYENWNEIYVQWEQRMKNLIASLDDIKVPELPEFEDEQVVMKASGIAQNHYVREAFHRCIEAFSVMWQHHFEMLMLGYGAYVVFFQFCKKAFPEIDDQTVARMVAGIDVLMFRPDDELKHLARLAEELGLGDIFTPDGNPDVILPAVGQRGEAGQRWLEALEKSRDPWFNISTGDGFYHQDRSWNDDLSIPFSALPHYIGLIRKGETLERPVKKLKRERTRIISEYRALLNSEDEQLAFDQILGLAHLVFPHVEDHKFYCEHWLTTRFFNKMREFGALMERYEVIDDAEDIFHLHYTEVEKSLATIMNSWAAGTPPANRDYWKPIIEKRKKILGKLADWQAPPAIGPMPEKIEDPALQMLWGITSETLLAWSTPAVGKAKNEIHGYAASAGVVEGVARVLRDISDFSGISDDEILVCPITHPSWAPLFSKIKAAVSDIGGTMSHMAIVAREYGLPAVVGTGQATQRIVSGQRIRVDGDRGIVTLLDE
ncbi:MAG: PEP-utilizing enzyme [Xanthomonadales bacterium]